MERETVKTVRTLKAHVALNVENVERSTEFYTKMLGLEPSKARPGYAKFDVQNPPLNLTLNEARGVQRGALSHMGIQVATTADVLAMRENWTSAGLVTQDEMQTNCCYALQDKTWVRDPDGNEWEAFVVLEDNLAETSSCCVAADAAAQGDDAAGSCATSTLAASEASSCCEATAAPVSISR
jgi:catechol 2,3-dioxygenase-like lactoylglutathione lyase family enzyme